MMMSRSQDGSGRVRPAVPLVRLTQLTATTWIRNRNATVMITNPLVIREFLLHLKLPPDPLPIAPAREPAQSALF